LRLLAQYISLPLSELSKAIAACDFCTLRQSTESSHPWFGDPPVGHWCCVLAPFFLFFGFLPFFVPAALASLHGQVSVESGWWQMHAHGKDFDDALPAPPPPMIFVPSAFGTAKSLLFA
jgi:hypothetical protein